MKQKTGKTIVDGATTSQRSFDATASFLMARVYDNLNYGGGILEFFSGNQCTTGGVIGWNYPVSWYGRVRSAQGFSNCRVKLWENTGFTGASIGFAPSFGYVGSALNDRTRSLQVTR